MFYAQSFDVLKQFAFAIKLILVMSLIIGQSTGQSAVDSDDKLIITARKENNVLSVEAKDPTPSRSVYNTPQVICSICNSISPDGFSEIEKKRMNAVGEECIKNPKKFMQNCDNWRDSFPFDHALNKSIRYTGCYKTVMYYEHDIEGNKKQEERVVRSCGFLGNPGCITAPGYGTTQKICFCTGPECNSSSELTSSLIVIFSLIVSSIVLRF